MQVEEVDEPWERLGEPIPAKWGNLTRIERNRLSGRRHSHQMKLYELYGIHEEDADRVLAAVEQDSHDLLGERAPKP
jgi:hypothetical protein